MFTDRQVHIIAYLRSTANWVNGAMIASSVGVSNRTLQMEIKRINEQLSGKAHILSNNRLGYRLEDKSGIVEIWLKEQEQKELNPYGNYGRSKQILMLLLFEKDYISIGEIADRLYISKSTINSNLAQVKRIVARTPGTILEVSNSRGIKICASENTKRIMCMKMMENKVDYATILRRKEFNNIYSYEDKLNHMIAPILTAYEQIITGEAYYGFIIYLAVSILRSNLGFIQEFPQHTTKIDKMVTEIAKKIEQELSYIFEDAEMQTIQFRINELNLIQKKEFANERVRNGIETFEKEIKNQTGYLITFDQELRNQLVDHVIRMQRRITSGHNNIGNHTKELILRYPLEFHLLKTGLSPILEYEIPESELEYLILYMSLATDKLRKKLRILLISDCSVGIIYTLQTKILSYHTDYVDTIKAIPMYLFQLNKESLLLEYDILITTDQTFSLQFKETFLMNEFVIPIQMDQLRQKIAMTDSSKRENQRKEIVAKYFKGYIDSKNGETNELWNHFFDKYLSDKKEKYVSVESIGKHILCIIDISSLDQSSQMWQFHMHEPMLYKGKHITEIIIAIYGGDCDMIGFFDCVQNKLNSIW